MLLLSDNTRTEVIVEAVRNNVTHSQTTGGHKRTLSNSVSRVGTVSAKNATVEAIRRHAASST